jgi:rSAM/selenodomain-associated transferase 1
LGSVHPLNESKNLRSLIIFAKKPVPGRVKTRLSPPLSAEAAAVLYSCMLLDTLATAAGLGGVAPVLFFQEEPGAAEYFSGLAPDMEFFPQEGADLGKRMENAFRNRFERGFREVVIIGTDSPDQPPEHILEAFDLLSDKKIDLVLGPAEDGGYYLMGLKSVRKELFCGIQWSSGDVLATTVSKAEELGLGVSLLPVWHDIDTAADLDRQELLDPGSPAKMTREFIISGLRPDNPHFADG